MDQWADRLQRAISEREFMAPLEEFLSARFPGPEGELPRVAFASIAASLVKRMCTDLCEQAAPESPLEEAMYWALLVEGFRFFDEVVVPPAPLSEHRDSGVPDTVWIEPQVNLGRYRVDFLLTIGQRWSRSEYATAQVVVECDGHDYHERTKDQAKRDRSRDRALQALGLRVLRFTGSEVWDNPLTCAREALLQGMRLTVDKLSEARDLPEIDE